MRKLFTEKADKILNLTGDGHKHLSLVLRARVGDEITVATGDGFDYLYTIDTITRTETVLKQTGRRENLSEPKTELTLFTAVLKGDKNESVVRACTELGVMRICPVVTEFTVAGGDSYRLERMRKIALEAAKQSGRGRVPEICAPVSFDEMVIGLSRYDRVIFPYERATETDMRQYLRRIFSGDTHKILLKLAAIVGSEGGFSEREAAVLTESGIVPVTLGKRILRADTACITVCAAILYEAGEMR